ncbi:MAG: arginine--tRNA ligase, partial [Acidobacteriaceae bacterium]|nr:arginine--tRNA ligase [Acidobacteriaceae bacterium]
MFQEIEERLASTIERELASRFQLDLKVSLEQPKQSSFGDLAIPVAFQLARELKRSPREIAGEISNVLVDVPGVSSFEIAGNGYINVRLKRGAYARSLLFAGPSKTAALSGKTIVEHTNINP